MLLMSYMHSLFANPSTYWLVVRKISYTGSLQWMTALPYHVSLKGMNVDKLEHNVYLVLNMNPMNVARLKTSDGTVVDTLIFSGINGSNDSMRIFILSDSSGYFTIAVSSTSGKTVMCRLLFSNQANAECQEISTISGFSFSHIMISDSKFFFIGTDPTSPYPLHMYKATFGSSTVDWAAKVMCPSGTCSTLFCESISSIDQSKIYSFFLYGSSLYLYLATLNASDGSVIGSRYKSSTGCTGVWGISLNGVYLVANPYCSPHSYFMIYNTDASTFTIKQSPASLYAIEVESATGRFVVGGGHLGDNSYITKFYAEAIDEHPDFTTTATWTMNVLSSGTEAILSDISASIASITTPTVTTTSSLNQTVTYNYASQTTSDVYFQITSQQLNIVENSIVRITPDLTCSSTGTTTISYSISNYRTSITPSWITIDSKSGVLTISTPDVTYDSEFDFYINSLLNGFTTPIQKLIILIVKDCTVQNCKQCSSSSNSCYYCNVGYSLSSGSCILPINNDVEQPSSIAKSLRESMQSLIALTTGIIIVLSMFNISSLSSLWSMINQVQIFFLLLLTRAYIPLDVKTIITGIKIALDPSQYIPFSGIGFYGLAIEKFNYDISNPSLDLLGIQSNSTIYNTASSFTSIIK